LSKLMHDFFHGKKESKNMDSFCNFQANLPKQSPNTRKIATCPNNHPIGTRKIATCPNNHPILEKSPNLVTLTRSGARSFCQKCNYFN
jgi:hypothetical protein